MSPKTGRPKSDNPKDVRFSIRIDATMYSLLRQRCEQEHITIAEFIRRAICDYLDENK